MKKLVFIALLMAARPLVYGQGNSLTDDDEVLDAPQPSREKSSPTKSKNAPSGKTITVSGYITDHNRKPLEGVQVEIININPTRSVLSEYSKKDGSYIYYRAPEDGILIITYNNDCIYFELTNKRTRIDVQLPASGENIAVRGRIKDSNGNLLNGVGVVASGVNGESAEVRTNELGIYEVKTPKNGALLFWDEGYTSQIVQVSGRTRIDVVLEKANK